ncbi:hypothetical protein B7993_00055 [Fibrobacter sp. UWH3]|nr:hypothetical protein B7993_00055 [Fibrobacter sp. UWH3]
MGSKFFFFATLESRKILYTEFTVHYYWHYGLQNSKLASFGIHRFQSKQKLKPQTVNLFIKIDSKQRIQLFLEPTFAKKGENKKSHPEKTSGVTFLDSRAKL